MVVAAQATPAGADGTETLHYGFKGQTSEARFFSTEGCVATEAFVHAVDGHVRFGPGRPDAESTVFVAVTRFDACNQQPISFALGSGRDLGDALQMDRLDGAALATTVQMVNLSTGVSFPMNVQLQWTGTGTPVRAREHIMLNYPGYRVNARETGTSRAANVVGAMSDGSVNYVSGATSSGTLSTVNDGQVVVLR